MVKSCTKDNAGMDSKKFGIALSDIDDIPRRVRICMHSNRSLLILNVYLHCKHTVIYLTRIPSYEGHSMHYASSPLREVGP